MSQLNTMNTDFIIKSWDNIKEVCQILQKQKAGPFLKARGEGWAIASISKKNKKFINQGF